jgi:hypothetical protein
MHGPAVTVDGGRKRKSYLIGLLDDATRVVPYAAFALSENTSAFLPVLQQAILRRGVPKRLYVDNGAAYRSNHLSLVCAKLGVTLIHARPYLPQGKGKQERWFRTVRMQLLPTLGEADLKSLDVLNRRLWAWIEGEYHRSPHKGLDGLTPLDRWMMAGHDVRLVGPESDLDEMFLFEQKRRVQRDRTISLYGIIYEVDASRGRDGHAALRSLPARPAGGRLLQGSQDRAGQARRSLRELLRPPRPHHQGAPPRQEARRSARRPAAAEAQAGGGLTCTASTSA